jgi:hypothetical protein
MNFKLTTLAESFIRTESDVKTLRFFVYTNHGQSICLKPEEGLCHSIREILGKSAGDGLYD